MAQSKDPTVCSDCNEAENEFVDLASTTVNALPAQGAGEWPCRAARWVALRCIAILARVVEVVPSGPNRGHTIFRNKDKRSLTSSQSLRPGRVTAPLKNVTPDRRRGGCARMVWSTRRRCRV